MKTRNANETTAEKLVKVATLRVFKALRSLYSCFHCSLDLNCALVV